MRADKDKKVVAAAAAVTEWLREEERAGQERYGPDVAPSPWSLSGRQEIMNARTLLGARLWK